MEINFLILLFIITFVRVATNKINTNSVNEENALNEDLDPVIDYLLNGGVLTNSKETDADNESTMSSIWKCGNCTDIEDSRIVYSEDYFPDDDDDDNDGNMQIELILEGMRCVTVSSDKSGVVQRLTGACHGAVTLHVTPSRRFVVHVYV